MGQVTLYTSTEFSGRLSSFRMEAQCSGIHDPINIGHEFSKVVWRNMKKYHFMYNEQIDTQYINILLQN